MQPRFGVTVVRSGRWWAIEVPELPGVRSQARRLDQVDAMAREAIALRLSVSEDSFELAIQTDLASLGPLEAPIEAALGARKAAAVAQDAASAAMRRAVAEIRGSGYTSRDAGMLLGVSNQRISQIETQAGERRT